MTCEVIKEIKGVYTNYSIKKNGNLIGDAQRGLNNKFFTIFHIKIHDDNNRYQGAGSFLLKYIEQDAINEGFKFVIGEWVDENPHSYEKIKKFVIKNGYREMTESDYKKYNFPRIDYRINVIKDFCLRNEG